MIVFDDISLRIAGRLLIEHATAAIPEGARVGMVGRNGSGKTTLFRAITGDLELETGEIHLPARARIGSVAQEAPAGPERLIDIVLAADVERARLIAERNATADHERIAEIEMRLVDIGAYAALARAARILAGLGLTRPRSSEPVRSSPADGGCAWRWRRCCSPSPTLLLLDEPTNYLDLKAPLAAGFSCPLPAHGHPHQP
jgi:ATP-binding cassette subfamily F protein 3